MERIRQNIEPVVRYDAIVAANTLNNNPDQYMLPETIEISNRFSALVDNMVDMDDNIVEKDEAKSKIKDCLMHQETFPQRNANNVQRLYNNVLVSANACTQTEQATMGTDTNDLEDMQLLTLNINQDKSFFKLIDYKPNKTIMNPFGKGLINLLEKHILKCKASAKLTYYLKCKHAFAVRSPQLLLSMRNDARVYLAMQDYKLETMEEYEMIAKSTLAAYMLDPIEMCYHKLVSNSKFINTVSYHNEAMSGILEVTQPSLIKSLFTGDRIRGKPWSLLFDKRVTIQNGPQPTI